MISQKTLKLYVYVDGVNDIPFYGVSYDDLVLANGDIFTTKDGFVFNVVHTNEQIEIGSFRYDTKRMGGAPTISFSLMYEECLDDLWSENIYAIFNGEKYFLKKTPTSSKSTEDARYKHDVELVSARVILDNVLFYDAVVGDPQGDDKPVSNSTKFVFFGKIDEFARRLNASLQYAKLQKVDENGEYESGYRVIVDDDITSEAMLVSFEDQYFSNAIQESYNTFKVPYYFVGEDIHFGNSNNVIAHEFSYGVDEALLSITKTNANNKVVNRITGKGSGENIPYYYPNNSAKGIIEAIPSSDFEVKILDYEKFADTISIDGIIRKSGVGYENALVTFNNESIFSGKTFSARMGVGGIKQYFDVSFISKDAGVFLLNFSSSVTKYLLEGKEKEDAIIGVVYSFTVYDETDKKWIQKSTQLLDAIDNLEVQVPHANHKYIISITCYYAAEGKYSGKGGQIVFDASYSFGSKSGWFYEDKVIELKDVGLMVEDDAIVGSTITQKLTKKISNSNVLLPPIYRNSDGVERFYNAINYPYPKPSNFDETLKKGYYGEDGILRNPYGEYDIEGYIHNDAYKKEDGTYIHFNNPYINGQPKEHIITLEDIKPTIKDAVNASGLRIDMFSEFAYDEDDNDETYIDEEGKTYFKHPYFFGKLRVLDFNLFECANENQPMTISFTSGDCGACNFEIGVTEDYPQKNPVQVYDNGSLKYKDGRVWCGLEDVEGQEVDEYQPRQQDTSKYEVWIALKKEEDTYGTLMPSKDTRPKPCSSATANDGDTFVILGINLPQANINKAEKKLEAEIIKYLQNNNVEKFNFSINFSRIYFEENPDVLELLNENASIYLWYNNIKYALYVSSISYSMGEGEVLPDIRVDLVDSLSVSQNAIQAAVSQVKADMNNALMNLDILTAVTPFFIRKDQDDEVQGRINFKKGIKFGEGGRVDILDDNSAKLTIEYLEVTKKAAFTSLEIQEKTHVGGQMLISPAAMNCGEVEELEEVYRCYFQTKGQDGEEIFNQFAVGDQAICQTYNAWGSRYYWRLVTDVGQDYIDLSKTDCDEGSDIPEAGDKIIQLGHRTDKTRQAAQVLSAHGETAPAFIMYNGINDYTLEGKEVTGILWNPATQEPQMYSYGNFFFGDRTTDENGNFISDFITFQPNPNNPDEKKLFINADVQFGGGSKGLSDLADWQDLQREVSDLEGSLGEIRQEAEQTTNDLNKAIEDAEKAAKDYTDEGKAALQKAIDELDAAKAGVNDVYTIAQADTIINSAEQRAAEAAEEYAAEAKRLAEETAKAYTDGEVDAAEAAAIAEAEKKVNAAKKELNEAIAEVEEIANIADAATKTLDTKISNIETGINESISEINAKLDGVVENYFDDYTPTRNNEPAATWIAEGKESEHIGDTFTNTSVDGENAGKSWRWLQQDSGIYDWQLIADTDAVKALIAASKAQTTADGKSRNFVVQPYPPYSIGDIWLQGEKGDLMRCKNTRETGSFTASDWEIATKYTDDTKANEAMAKANDASTLAQNASNEAATATETSNAASAVSEAANKLANEAKNNASEAITKSNTAQDIANDAKDIADSAQALADSAKTLAQTANTNADKAVKDASDAKSEASTATSKLSDWSSDLVISPFEKQGVKDELAFVVADKNDIDKQVTKYELTTNAAYTTFGSKFTAYKNDLTTITNATTESVSIPSGMTTHQSEYYTARTTLLEAIATAAKKVATDAQTAADTAQKAADDAQTLAEEAKKAVEDLSNELTNDYGYLKDVFGQVTEGNAILSKYLGVGTRTNDNTFSMNAYLDGSGLVTDSADGKLMIATGIPATGGTLAQRAARATTRIYEMGKIVTNSLVATNADITGKVTSTSGKIGGFTIGENGLFDDTANTASFIRLGNLSSTGYVYLGKGLITLMSTIDNGELAGGGVINVTAQDAAFRCTQGMFYGLRPRTRTISSNTELTKLDHTIYITSSNITITLPSAAVGQCYTLIKSKTISNVVLSGDRFLHLHGGTSTLPTNATTIWITRVATSAGIPIWTIDCITH